jgi:cell shape-determining protein MreC
VPPQPEALEWLKLLSSIVTPLAIFWLGIVVFNRRATVEGIDKKISDIRKEISEGRTECREDIQAMVQQMAEYPRRNELNEAIKELRADIREERKLR